MPLSELTGGGAAALGGNGGAAPLAGANAVVTDTQGESGRTSTVDGIGDDAVTAAAGAGGTGSSATGGESGAYLAGGDGGMAGDSGGRPILCEGAPLPPKASWHASASHSSLGNGEYDNKPEYVMDMTAKRWSTGKGQSGDEWLQVDFGVSALVRELTFTLNPDDAEDYPRIYQIRVSDTPLDFSDSIRASGSGLRGQTLVVTLAEPVEGRYLLVQQKGKDTSAWWSISELTAKCF